MIFWTTEQSASAIKIGVLTAGIWSSKIASNGEF